MAAPKGSQFWKMRAKHGRNKLFATPELMWEAALEYFEWCDTHPLTIQTKIKTGPKGDEEEKIVKRRPYLLIGFLQFIGASQSFWKEFKKANHINFLPVIAQIEEAIANQQFEGASSGEFNSNIIARLLGLYDNINHFGNVDSKIVIEHVRSDFDLSNNEKEIED